MKEEEKFNGSSFVSSSYVVDYLDGGKNVVIGDVEVNPRGEAQVETKGSVRVNLGQDHMFLETMEKNAT